MRTMGRILANWRITFAALFAVLLVGGAYLAAKSVEYPARAQASTESALLQAIATKDSDGDGLPDWEEVLYGTDPHIVDTNKLGMTDGEAVTKGLIVPKAIANVPAAPSATGTTGIDGLPPAPAEGTLTAAFSQSFFTLYLQAKQNAGGADLTDSQIADIANQAVSTLSSSIAPAPDYKKASELTQGSSGSAALQQFASDAEKVLKNNSNSATTTELMYLKYAQEGDAVALTKLSDIAKSYRLSAAGIAALPVPPELVVADLELVNALMRMNNTISDFTRVNSDPLAAMLALTQYQLVAQALAKAFNDVNAAYSVAGVKLLPGTPGASFVNLITDIPTTRNPNQL